jgi:hypothetical protein
MIIHQFNQTSPKLFETNRTQVNINIVEAIKTTIDGDVSGYEYDTVVVENAYMYTDESLELLAKLTYAKQYLVDTDFKMTADYDKDVTDIKVKRQEAREFIRVNS